MKKIFNSVILFLALSVCLSACASKTGERVSADSLDKQLFLVVGFDDAAENTDVIFTLGYDRAGKSISIVQIPRDTYCEAGTSQNKLNQIYATARSRGLDKNEAMVELADTVSKVFGISFDGYIGVTTDGFRGIVRGIGGVDVELPVATDIVAEDGRVLHLSAGVNHLDENDAEIFVRHRSGYAMGDIGRLDAQKLFLSAVFKKTASDIGLSTLLSLYSVLRSEVVTNVDAYALARAALSVIREKDTLKKTLLTAPGEPTTSETGLSYYVINRKNMSDVCREYMFATLPFDEGRRLTRDDVVSFKSIYEDKNAYYRVYTDDGVMDIRIPGA